MLAIAVGMVGTHSRADSGSPLEDQQAAARDIVIKTKELAKDQASRPKVALAVALLVHASPASAGVVTLVCQSEANKVDSIIQGAWGTSFTLRINYDQKVVDLLGPSGAVWFSAAATITESAVQWDDWDCSSGYAPGFSGLLNRLSGQGVANFKEKGEHPRGMTGPCRRATRKF